MLLNLSKALILSSFVNHADSLLVSFVFLPFFIHFLFLVFRPFSTLDQSLGTQRLNVMFKSNLRQIKRYFLRFPHFFSTCLTWILLIKEDRKEREKKRKKKWLFLGVKVAILFPQGVDFTHFIFPPLIIPWQSLLNGNRRHWIFVYSFIHWDLLASSSPMFCACDSNHRLHLHFSLFSFFLSPSFPCRIKRTQILSWNRMSLSLRHSLALELDTLGPTSLCSFHGHPWCLTGSLSWSYCV